MPESMGQIWSQVQGMPPSRRLTLGVTALGSLLFLLWLAWGTARGGHQTLYRGLDGEEAAHIVEALEAERIDYRLEDGGTAVSVPATRAAEARMRVASSGLPGGAGTGFEIFDTQGFGVTDFVQRVNFRRAIQGELARSVAELDSVSRARVQIAMPDRNTFVSDLSRKSSASVVVELEPGQELERGEVQAIVHLVASSVEGLDTDHVTVVDHRGRMLAPQGDGAPGPTAPAGAHAHQARLEAQLSERVEGMLARTVGPGRVIAKVRADLDWTQTETTEERFDPEGQVARSEQITTEESREGGDEAGGIPGLGGRPLDVAASPPAGSTRTSETINYEISKSVSRVVRPVGSVKRLHVAVLIDGKPAGSGADPGPQGEPAFVPWSAEELEQFEQLVQQAVGFDAKRGDEITLTSAPFHTFDFDAEESPGLLPPEVLPLVATLVRYAGLLVALLLFARLVVGPLLRAAAENPPAPVNLSAGDFEAQLAGGAVAAGHGAGASSLPPPPPPSLSEQVSEVARERSDDGVKAIQNWLSQG